MVLRTARQAKDKRKIFKWAVISAVPLFAILLYLVFASERSLANWAVRWFSRPVRDFLGTVCGIVPFSVMELIYTAAVIFVIAYIVRTVALTIKADRRLLLVLKRVVILALVVVYILGAYLLLWGIDYQADSFSDKEGLEISGVSVEELYEAAEFFVLKAVSLADTVERDSGGHFNEDMDSLFNLSVLVYDNLDKEFPSIAASSRIPKKMIFSKIMSITGFTGIYFPFTGESNINIDAPAAFIPFTIAHELAHQRGVYSEQECNFLGIAACVTSGITVYEYSGYLAGSLYLMNALYRASPELWREVRQEFSGAMLVDWRDNSEYWSSMESKVTAASEAVYDTYLKANGQELGIQSYGACVDLLVAYYMGLL